MLRRACSMIVPIVLCVLVAACASGRERSTGRHLDAGPRPADTGPRRDTGDDPRDAGDDDPDTGTVRFDSGPPRPPDSGPPRPPDAGPPRPPDAGPPRPPDSGPPDAGPPVGGELVSFPSVGDTWSVSGEHIWMMGEYVEGRRTSIARATRATIHAVFDYNGLTCDGQDMRLTINGTEAGRFRIDPGATVLDTTFTFAAVTGPAFTLRYENVREVASGCGSARFDKTLSTIRLVP